MEKSKMDRILIHGYVITMDSGRRVIRDGAVAVKDGKIEAVGKTEEILSLYEGEKFDCKGGIVHPGLIDAHEHIGQHITRGWEPDSFTVEDTWTKFECHEFPNLAPEFEVAGTRLSVLEMIKNGTTTFSDTGSLFFMEDSIEGINEVGIKGIVGECTGDAFQPELWFLTKKTDEVLGRMEQNISRYGRKTGRRVHAGTQLCGMGDCTDELVKGAKAIADANQEVLFMHQCVYKSEFDAYMEKYGKSPISHLSDLGVLDEKTTLVHMIHLTDEDVNTVAVTRTNAVHCPAASLKFALGSSSVGKFPEMEQKGVKIALGTDSGTWADAMDVFQLVYLAATIHREARCEHLPINSYRAFEMATLDGAKALGLEKEIGSLEKGKSADIVVHGTDIPECVTDFDPFTNLVYSQRSKSVKHVMIDGEWVVRDGHAVLVDEEKIMAEAREAGKKFEVKTGYHLYSPWNVF